MEIWIKIHETYSRSTIELRLLSNISASFTKVATKVEKIITLTIRVNSTIFQNKLIYYVVRQLAMHGQHMKFSVLFQSYKRSPVTTENARICVTMHRNGHYRRRDFDA